MESISSHRQISEEEEAEDRRYALYNAQPRGGRGIDGWQELSRRIGLNLKKTTRHPQKTELVRIEKEEEKKKEPPPTKHIKGVDVLFWTSFLVYFPLYFFLFLHSFII